MKLIQLLMSMLCLFIINTGIISQISIIENDNIGFGEEAPLYPFHFKSDQNNHSFFIEQMNVTTSEKDVLTILDRDNAGWGQDHSSLLKLWKSGSIHSGALGFSLLELTFTNNATDNMYWIKSQIIDEKNPSWGISLHSSNFLTQGGVYVGATGNTDGTITGGASALLSNGDLGLHTIDPQAELHVNGFVNRIGEQTPSDKRLKSNIKTFDKGLQEVLQMNPITFDYKSEFINSDRNHIGLSAQEIQKIVPEIIGTASYVGEKKSKEEYLNIYDNEIKFLLINAIKEQQELIEDLQTEIKEIKSSQSLGNIESDQDIKLEHIEGVAVLGQNTPNPHNGHTFISYYVPENSIAAEIQFYTQQGQLIKESTINDFGEDVLKINADDLPQGSYLYSLVVDGELISTKKMMVAK